MKENHNVKNSFNVTIKKYKPMTIGRMYWLFLVFCRLILHRNLPQYHCIR